MASYGAYAGLAGSIISTIGKLMKSKVKAPDYVPTLASEEAQRATAANLGTLGQAEELAAKVNEGAQARLLKSLEAAVPGAGKIIKQTGANIQANLEGRISEDVARNIQRATASRAISAGTSGSQFARNLTARDFGLTSLQLMNQGIQQSNQWLQSTRQNLAPQFDVTSMFVSPAQQIALTQQNRANKWNIDYLQNQLKAKQSWNTILGEGAEQFGQSLSSMGSMGGGGMGGGGGGGGAPSGGSSMMSNVNFGPSNYSSFGVGY